MRFAILAALALILPGCASVIDGTSQSISFASNPSGADCEAWRDGKLLTRVTTPNTVTVKKTKHDINVTCKMDGYHESTDYLKSEIQDATWGNILLGGGIGWAIDSASGADNKYREQITLTMVPLQPGEVAKSVINPASQVANTPVVATTEGAALPAEATVETAVEAAPVAEVALASDAVAEPAADTVAEPVDQNASPAAEKNEAAPEPVPVEGDPSPEPVTTDPAAGEM